LEKGGDWWDFAAGTREGTDEGRLRKTNLLKQLMIQYFNIFRFCWPSKRQA